MTEIIACPKTGKTLHQIYRVETLAEQMPERVDLGTESNFLQVAAMRILKPKHFRAHTHLERKRSFSNLRAQESWVVIRGEVEVHYFDESDELISIRKLKAGDLSITFFGGHGYEIKTIDTLIYEFKSGPYEGQQIDKRFLSDDK